MTSAVAAEVDFHFPGCGKKCTPCILQSEVTECGLACLAMIASHHGHRTNLLALRQRFSVSSRGTRLKDLIDMSGKLGFIARGVRLEPESLQQLNLPCVLHWDMSHFVVLTRVDGSRFHVNDPAVGARKLTLSEMSAHMTGVALELQPGAEFRAQEDKPTLRLHQLWQRIDGLGQNLAILFCLSLMLQVFAVASPFFMQTVVDDVLMRGDAGLLAALATGFGLLLLIECGVSVLRQWVILSFSSRLGVQLAANVFRHLIRLPVAFFHKRHMGDIVSRFGSSQAINDMLSTGLITGVVDGLMATVTLLVMFVYSPQLAWLVLGIVIIYTLIRCLLYPVERRLAEQCLLTSAQTESHFMESVRAIQTIKLFQRENDRQSQWQNLLVTSTNRSIHASQIGIVHGLINLLLFGAGNIASIYLAAQSVMSGIMSLGMMYAFMSYKQRFVQSVDGFISQIFQLRMLGVHLERLADIALTPIDSESNGDAVGSTAKGPYAQSSAPETPQLQLSNLCFSYGGADAAVFADINLRIDRGEHVAITGPSGCGKSTLMLCLMGLLSPTQGAVSFNGHPLSRSPDYRQRIAAVLQDDQLLSGSIAENIACFAPDIDMQRVVQCAAIACLHDSILTLPMQYNSLVGEMGSSLSGGQKQRLLIARALYRQPDILFLDEATSQLDVATEQRIAAHISQLSITRVVVAHREATIRSADRIIEFGAGDAQVPSVITQEV
ncbi:peptidase domain-containing ABC transporter [Parahalioglobus pacificus]|uniref:ABC transporter n=1 Tax=Parahalioglobus pacificus TaxID=930806 RepID=A0A918XKA8_9GAMM|nr:peptidase domain-containing ABC transporter [Halioglobus pacificus]GHD34363.1 ABC transporter [Halioglobus pacificus]